MLLIQVSENQVIVNWHSPRRRRHLEIECRLQVEASKPTESSFKVFSTNIFRESHLPSLSCFFSVSRAGVVDTAYLARVPASRGSNFFSSYSFCHVVSLCVRPNRRVGRTRRRIIRRCATVPQSRISSAFQSRSCYFFREQRSWIEDVFAVPSSGACSKCSVETTHNEVRRVVA